MPAQIFCLSLLPPPHTASCRIVFARPNSPEMSPLELQPASLHCGQEAITGPHCLLNSFQYIILFWTSHLCCCWRELHWSSCHKCSTTDAIFHIIAHSAQCQILLNALLQYVKTRHGRDPVGLANTFQLSIPAWRPACVEYKLLLICRKFFSKAFLAYISQILWQSTHLRSFSDHWTQNIPKMF